MPPTRRETRTASTTATREATRPYPTRADNHHSSHHARPITAASVDRSANGTKPGLRLTVKAPPSKLRQATSSSSIPPSHYAEVASESDTTPAPTARPARSTRNNRTLVEPDSDDIEDDEADEEDAEGEDEEDVDDEAGGGEVTMQDDEGEEDEEEGDSEEDAEGDEDEDEDETMLDADAHLPPPIIKHTSSRPAAHAKSKPHVTVTAPPTDGPLKSVEEKEVALDEASDDELSELDDDDEEGTPDSDADSDGDDLSRSATPDLTKLTRRQRGIYDEDERMTGEGLLSLSNEAQKKKHLTAEEHAMRRAEMARRRKNLSEKRNEEEKMDTINKLLKKPAPKRRTKAEMLAAQHAAERMESPARGGDEGDDGAIEITPANPVFTRYVVRSGPGGGAARLGVPEEWIAAGLVPDVGQAEKATGVSMPYGRMVEEIV